MTIAEPQPDEEPDVTAKMNKINAAGEYKNEVNARCQERPHVPVSIDTPTMSRLFQRALLVSSIPESRLGFGTRKMHSMPMGIATSATNQKTHDQFANCTKIAPMMRPLTEVHQKTMSDYTAKGGRDYH